MAEERLQRRLAAILSADVVSYSRLMGVDEAGTLARLKAIRRELIDPAIAAHSGRIVKLMGDGALVEFASADDAVTCAIEIQRQLRERDTDRAFAGVLKRYREDASHRGSILAMPRPIRDQRATIVKRFIRLAEAVPF